MVRAFVLVTCLLSFGSASALQITSEITGADMAGMRVTANFADGSSETAIWATTLTDAGIANGEGFRGAATGSGWSLAQQGFTLGNVVFDGQGNVQEILGLWTLSNDTDSGMVSVVIEALAANVVFDIIGIQNGDTAEYTPGSNVGRGFQSALGPNFDAVAATYSDLVSAPDLYGTLTINFREASTVLASGEDLQFLADTDKIPLPAPALLMLLGLAGLAARARAVS